MKVINVSRSLIFSLIFCMQHPVPVVSSPGNKGKLKSHVVLPVAPARKSDLQRNGVQIVSAAIFMLPWYMLVYLPQIVACVLSCLSNLYSRSKPFSLIIVSSVDGCLLTEPSASRTAAPIPLIGVFELH